MATLLLLSFQLTVLVVSTMPDQDSCCCVAAGKKCKCKSHAGKGHSEELPPGGCVQKSSPGCGTSQESLEQVLEAWVTLPEPPVSLRPLPPPFIFEWPVDPFASRFDPDTWKPPPRG